MLKRPMLDIRYVCAICVLLLSHGFAYPQSQEPIQAPRVKAEQQTKGSAESKEDAEKQTNQPSNSSAVQAQQTSTNSKRHGQTNGDQSTEEVSEYWPILGHRLKITDTLLAAFTFLLVIATTGLIVVGVVQSRQLKRTVDLAIEDLISTHRPHVIVRRCFHVLKSGPGTPAVEYVIANCGDTAATIVEMSTKLSHERLAGMLSWNPSNPSYARGVAASFRIESGEAITKMHDENAEELFTAAGAAPESDLLFLGYIVYEDGIGRKRRTAFYRRYDRSTKRFVPMDDKDYEYQD